MALSGGATSSDAVSQTGYSGFVVVAQRVSTLSKLAFR